ncbi:ABC transporter ATP-binding protein [Sinirhodobacter populi]|uniref:ABC transporter ATP-binding protein n=1 Tax=Paenirhodobacter populi TaxID=2306993 RepID=A0A443K4I6_9RHOB|nr:ABC transporter ATP-binding protein [Sinirhodobacter populi]RWR27697.1 ABC transporter ATP-binding protein [Sinirhodobacter populi]
MAYLDVRNLGVAFGPSRVVEDLSFALDRGEALAIVGESGCGKSMTALALMRLLARGARTSGEIRLDGEDLLALSEARMRRMRGRRLGIIFQDPMSALNPVLTVAEQLTEAIRAHETLDRADALDRAVELLERVQIPDAARRIHDYPHQFSGGMRQRAAIAIAIAARPDILIADEPTTALDVTIQAQILQLISDLRRESGMALILVTHDLGVVAETVDRVLVMYAGRKVEEQRAQDLFAAPRHPYTNRLIASKPQLRVGDAALPGRPPRLPEIPGLVPLPGERGQGCAFAGRCDRVETICTTAVPALDHIGTGSGQVACYVAHQADAAQSAPARVAALAGGIR